MVTYLGALRAGCHLVWGVKGVYVGVCLLSVVHTVMQQTFGCMAQGVVDSTTGNAAATYTH